MTSPTTVANRALALLGQQPITDIADPEDGKAIICNQHYDSTVETVFGLHTWRDLTKSAVLQGAQVPEPINKWVHAFPLPADLVSGPDAAYNSTEPHPDRFFDWEVKDGLFLTNWEEVVIDYRYNPPPGKWRPHLMQLIVYAFTAIIAKPITEDNALAAHWWGVAFGRQDEGMLGGYCRTARNIDAKSNVPASIDSSELISARLGGYGLPGRGG